MRRVIIVGSPRTNGRSAHLAEMLFETNIDERPTDELFLVPVSELEIGPCIGCDGCKTLTQIIVKDDSGEERTELRPRCVFDDDMQTLYDLLDDADELTIVSPVFFSGAPALMKCILDRMQPYYWANTREEKSNPATLHVIGEGGDPHGYGALVSEVKSALSCAGFKLDKVLDWVGKIDAEGEITAEATVYDAAAFAPIQPTLNIAGDAAEGASEQASHQADKPDSYADDAESKAQGKTAPQGAASRPKLDLSGGTSSKQGQQKQSKGKQRSPQGAQQKNSAKGSSKKGKGRG